MAYVSDVFNASMALMDELDTTGSAQSSDTKEYEYRTPAIIDLLTGELRILTGDARSLMPIESMDDYISGVSDTYALTVLPYGLAANLLIDENPTAASYYQQRYEELRDRFSILQPAAQGEVQDIYGGLEYGRFSRW